jgi:glycosyltransferase involved in cell wall biosynthesis
MNNQSLKVSLIIAVKNGEKVLQRCLDSIHNQSYKNIEIIIIDGNSTDQTVKIINYNSENIKYWESKPDRGVYHAWNKALDHVEGDWICFLGADDFFWEPDIIEKIIHHVNKDRNQNRIFYGKVNRVDDQGRTITTIGEPWTKLKHKFKKVMCLPHPGLMHHKSIFERHGRFREDFKIAGDYDLLLRELKDGNAQYIPFVTVGMQSGGLSTLPKNEIISIKEMRQAQKLNGIHYPSLKWIMGYLKAFTRLFFYLFQKSLEPLF